MNDPPHPPRRSGAERRPPPARHRPPRAAREWPAPRVWGGMDQRLGGGEKGPSRTGGRARPPCPPHVPPAAHPAPAGESCPPSPTFPPPPAHGPDGSPPAAAAGAPPSGRRKASLDSSVSSEASGFPRHARGPPDPPGAPKGGWVRWDPQKVNMVCIPMQIFFCTHMCVDLIFFISARFSSWGFGGVGLRGLPPGTTTVPAPTPRQLRRPPGPADGSSWRS